MAGSSSRVSIRPYLLPYLQQFGESIGTDDVTEIVNAILIDHKLGSDASKPVQASDRAVPTMETVQAEKAPNLLDELDELL